MFYQTKSTILPFFLALGFGGAIAGGVFTAVFLQEPRHAFWGAVHSSIPPLVTSGSGFWVSQEGHIVTSAHVVDGCRRTAVWGVDGRARKSDVVGFDRPRDLVLLHTSGPVPEVARIVDWQND